RANSSSLSSSPKSAKMLPEPSSNVGSWFLFLMFRPFLCFRVALLDQVHILLGRRNAFLRFLLKGVQHLLAELDGYHRAVGVAAVPQSDFEHAAADSLERLGILRHPAELDQLQLVAEELLCALRKRLDIALGVSHPDQRPQRRCFLLVVLFRTRQ